MQSQFSTLHYDFYYSAGSTAERDIVKIAAEQERCFEKITKTLDILPQFKIEYFLYETPQEVGIEYDGDNEPCNGFTRLPNKIYAVYNEHVQCVGMHEDTHIISYCIKRPTCAFLREGLAMYMDETWWGKSNQSWVRDFLQNGQYVPILNLLKNDFFFKISDAVSYPIAGAFVKYLVEKVGMSHFLYEIYYKDNIRVSEFEDSFIDWVSYFDG